MHDGPHRFWCSHQVSQTAASATLLWLEESEEDAVESESEDPLESELSLDDDSESEVSLLSHSGGGVSLLLRGMATASFPGRARACAINSYADEYDTIM